ncbi:MAG: ABC transporter permease [Bacteroidetes bacterium]|nr:ABC transporter permease [Bacteroidota bacterium]
MFRNYLKIALRQLRKQKFYSAIKIGGFALGIATCLLITLYIRSELSYDKDYPEGDRLFRITGEFKNEDGSFNRGAAWQAPFAQALKNDYPQIEQVARIMPYKLFWGAGNNQFRRLDRTQDVYEEGFTWADSTLPVMFGFKMVYGNAEEALARPFTLIMSRRKAEKFYPGQDPVGKQVVINDEADKPWTIGGVMEDPSPYSHLDYDFYLSMTGHKLWDGEQESWNASNYDTYIKVRPGTNRAQLEDNIQGIVKKFWYPVMVANGNKMADVLLKNLRYQVQPVADIHLGSEINDSHPHGDRKYIWLFGAIAAFILILACINFINLSTARSANRAKEVGLRKVVGSRRTGLVQQFLTESLVLSMFSFLLAIGLAWALLPLFNKLAGTSIRFPWGEWWLVPIVLGSMLLVGLVSGLYPSFYLSAFRPVEVLKGQVARGSRHSGLRSVLVVFQFTTSVILIIATMVVYSQMQMILNRKMGFDKDQVLLIQGTGTLDKQLPAFKADLEKLSGIKAVSITDFLPLSGGKRNMNTWWEPGHQKTDQGVAAQRWYGDVDYMKVLGVKMAEGRSFSPVMPTDSQAVVINQAMARKLGWKNPIGRRIANGGLSDSGHIIIGVMEDFNFEKIKQDVGPLCLFLGRWSSIVAVKMNTKDIKGMISGVGGVWKKFAPQQSLRYTFMDEEFQNMYKDVQRTGNITTALATLAIVIACLGLFALSAFMAEQRRKEMGIRKVLGASVAQVAGLLSRDFLKLVLIAFVIASPIAYLMMNKWLEDYVYRISIGAWMFAGAGAMVLLIALATICVQAIRAAITSPVGALKQEG